MAIDKNHYFPQYLSGTIQVLNWDLDVVIVTLSVIALASKIGKFFSLDIYTAITWVVVIVVPIWYNRAKKRNATGYIKHLFYKVGLRNFKYYPDPYIKKFIN